MATLNFDAPEGIANPSDVILLDIQVNGTTVAFIEIAVDGLDKKTAPRGLLSFQRRELTIPK